MQYKTCLRLDIAIKPGCHWRLCTHIGPASTTWWLVRGVLVSSNCGWAAILSGCRRSSNFQTLHCPSRVIICNMENCATLWSELTLQYTDVHETFMPRLKWNLSHKVPRQRWDRDETLVYLKANISKYQWCGRQNQDFCTTGTYKKLGVLLRHKTWFWTW